MSNQEVIEYRYQDVLTTEFQIKEHKIEFDKIEEDLKTDIESNFQFKLGDNLLSFRLFLFGKSNFNDEEVDCFTLKTRHIFWVKNLKESHFYEERNDLKVNPQFLVTLASISFSTTRGLLKEKLASSRYKDLLLPVVDPKKFVEINNEESEANTESEDSVQ